MSTDNKAYRPSQSDMEASDEDFEDGKKGRRKRKKKEPLGGPLSTLPVAAYDKKKKRKSRGSKGNLAGPDDEDESGSDEHISEQVSFLVLTCDDRLQRSVAFRNSAYIGTTVTSICFP
jgi:SUN domain-containing protein 1/2